MQYIEAPNNTNAMYKSIFLAGGIQDCGDWQKDLIGVIAQSHLDVTVFNPRRAEKFINVDDGLYLEQVKWEFEHLREADIVGFWFGGETFNPTTLFEYGSALERNGYKNGIVVGCDKRYYKRRNIIVQTSLINPRIKVHVGFENFTGAVLKRIKRVLSL